MRSSFSSAENYRRGERRISLITCSAGSFAGSDFCPICAPSMATMGQQSSLPQPAIFVSQALMPDSVCSVAEWLSQPERDQRDPPLCLLFRIRKREAQA
jgi:hypothetical protein